MRHKYERTMGQLLIVAIVIGVALALLAKKLFAIFCIGCVWFLGILSPKKTYQKILATTGTIWSSRK